MNFILEYHMRVVNEDIPSLPKKIKERIKKAVEAKLTTAPEHYGKPLRRSLRGYRGLRVGDYRVVFRIEGNKVKVLLISHRSVVYETALSRI